METPRILVVGFFHETNTFVEDSTGIADFDWHEGNEVLLARGDGSPLDGVLQAGENCEWEIIPALDCRAMPSGIVEREVYDTFYTKLKQHIDSAREQGIDGIAFVFHGAMVVQGMEDPEGTLLASVRQMAGLADIPIVGVVDLHANVSPEMVEHANGWIAYRENPHIDGFESGLRVGELLHTILSSDRPIRTVYRHSRLLIPPPGTATGGEPFKQMEELARKLESDNEEFLHVNVVPGFAHADVADAGTTFNIVTSGSHEKAEQALELLCRTLEATKAPAFPREWALEEAIQEARAGAFPALLVEPADNIGAGAPGDCTSVLRGLLEAQVPKSAIVIDDAAAAKRLHQHAVGDRVTVELGGKGSSLDPGPVRLELRVAHLSDGCFQLEDRQSHLATLLGQNVDMGPTAVAEAGNVTILITSHKTPPFDLGMWRSQGYNPEEFSLVGIKAAVAHRRAWDKVTTRSFMVDVPGPCSSNLHTLPFKNIRRPIYPLD